MTKIKLCGLSRECDIEAVNELCPEYIGFVFANKSKRYVTPAKAKELRTILNKDIKAVGVFVNEDIEKVSELLENDIIDIAQLHGSEDEEYILKLREKTQKPIIKAFKISSSADAVSAEKSSADFILLDSGAGTGSVFDWEWLSEVKRPYFLAGGLSPDNVESAIKKLSPYAVDVSSGIETEGVKDKIKMKEFVSKVRNF
ncbi:MAG: phosphoribosylanthranilate isomerase [Lachnospiraceae bacterium]|nr:phosphoribosylanthranilate isomerase [Lachnospiraceae bacterium]